jgi:acetoin utilization deacetylase AcuC-like enzyme
MRENLFNNWYNSLLTVVSVISDENCSGRLALFLEGGYDLKVCSTASLAISKALLGEEWDDPLGESDYHETDQWKPDLERIRREWKI